MRDESSDMPIPDQFKPDTQYHDGALADFNKVLTELPKLTAEECEARAEKDFNEAMAWHNERAETRVKQEMRYNKMLAKVKVWEVPEEISGLKIFMQSQLDQSIDFDCDGSICETAPIRLTGEKWREKELALASKNLAYHTKARAEEIERVKDRNRWLKALRDSLPKETA